MKRYTQGFTLIELLVVIAIIGILASVVLVSLSSARNKGKDAKVEGQMSELRNAGEMYYSSNSNKYQSGSTAIAECPTTSGTGSFLSDTNTGWNIVSAIETDLGLTAATASKFNCGVTAAGDAWSVSVALPSDSTKFFCVDSAGKSEPATTVGSAGATSCP